MGPQGGAGRRAGREAFGVCAAQGAASYSVRCESLGAFGTPSPFWALLLLLEGTLGLEPHCYGVECPSPNEGINLSLTIHGPLMLEGASVPPSVKLVNNSYR